MTTDSGQIDLDSLPPYLDDDAKRAILALVDESAPTASIECSEPVIRHWCEALEDGNPLYLDEEYARSQGFSGIVAPPAINSTLSIPYRWPQGDRGPETGGPLHFELKRLMKLPVGVIVGNEIDYLAFVEIGDRLYQTTRLVSITGPKTTRLGEGWFWVMESLARNQRDEVVLRSQMTAFAYDPGNQPEEEDTATGGFSRATEEELRADECTHLPADQQVYWEEVDEGDVLPTLFMPITVTRCVYAASATRDFSPHHTNRDYAQQQVQARDMFLNTPFNMGMLSRFATEWGGPLSRLRKLKLAMRENICAGDDMSIDGRIVSKHAADGEYFVDIDIQVSTQHGPAYEATATVLLPNREA